ncbi:MAG: hypothetical protein HC806_07640 [Anaerolineae bacterium]|nr:hypothetical protein [Anaerolineae bacterium]
MSKDDRIFPIIKVISAIVIPFLVLAFIILYFFPGTSGDRFAWEIQPQIMAMFMGAGYIGGAWLFINVVFGRHWHRVAPGFFPVTSFTIAMLVATILHWDRFNPSHFPFQLWFGLYIVTPFLVTWMWWYNHKTDPGTPEPNELFVPSMPRIVLRVLGVILLLYAIAGFLSPTWLIQTWVWELKPLTARVLSGWFSLLGVGGLVISRETRWSSWRVGIESIGIWHFLVVIAAFTRQTDFPGGVWNWYVISVILMFDWDGVLYIQMQLRQVG